MKKIACLVLSFLLAFGAAGCAGEEEPVPRTEASFQTGQPSQQELIESLRGEPIQFTDDLFIHPIPYAKPGNQLTDEEAAAIGESLLREGIFLHDEIYMYHEVGYDPEQVIEQDGYLYGKAKYFDSLEGEQEILSQIFRREYAEAISQDYCTLMREDGFYIRLEGVIAPGYRRRVPLEVVALSKKKKQLTVRAHLMGVGSRELFDEEIGDLVFEILEQDGHWVLKDFAGELPSPEQMYQPKEIYSYPRETEEIQLDQGVSIHPVPYMKPGNKLTDAEAEEICQSLLRDGECLMVSYSFGWFDSYDPKEYLIRDGMIWYKMRYFQTAAEFEGAFATIFSRYFARRTAGQIVRYSRYREWDGELYFSITWDNEYPERLTFRDPVVVSKEAQKLVVDITVGNGRWYDHLHRYTIAAEDGRWVIEDFKGLCHYGMKLNETASGEIPQGGLD